MFRSHGAHAGMTTLLRSLVDGVLYYTRLLSF